MAQQRNGNGDMPLMENVGNLKKLVKIARNGTKTNKKTTKNGNKREQNANCVVANRNLRSEELKNGNKMASQWHLL